MLSTCRFKDDGFNIWEKKAFPQLKSISRIIPLFFREYSGNNDATSVNSRIRRIRKRIIVLSAGIYGASQSWTANPESGFLLQLLSKRNECGAYWSNTSVCQKYTVTPGNLYSTTRTIQVAVGFNLRTTAAKAINSMITVNSGISTSYHSRPIYSM